MFFFSFIYRLPLLESFSLSFFLFLYIFLSLSLIPMCHHPVVINDLASMTTLWKVPPRCYPGTPGPSSRRCTLVSCLPSMPFGWVGIPLWRHVEFVLSIRGLGVTCPPRVLGAPFSALNIIQTLCHKDIIVEK